MESPDNGVHPLFLILLVMGGGYLLFYVWRRWYRGKKTIDIHLSPFSLLVLFSLFFFVIAFSWFEFYHLTTDTIVAPYPGIFMHYGFMLSALGFILLVCVSVGKYILHWLKWDDSYNVKTFLFSFGLGSMLLTFILFLLGLGGYLRSIPVWTICIILLLITYKELWLWVKAFFKPQLHFQGGYWDVRIFLFFLFFIVLGHHALELIRPMPMGFDDLAVYMNVPNLLARGGKLLSGIDAYSWGIFMSLGYLLFHSTMITLFLSLLGGILAFLGLYVAIQSYGEQRNMPHAKVRTYALLSVTLFGTLPTVIFQSAKDMKVDLAALFFILLSFIALLTWRTEKERLLLCLSGIFVGFAFTIKYTVLFFMITILLYVGYQLRKREQKNAIFSLFIFILCMGGPFIPYAVKNIGETQQLSITSLRVGKSETPTIVLNPPLADAGEAISPPLFTGVREELGRYAGFDEGIMKYLMLPFTVTFNPITSGMYVDIGYIFLAFIPLVLLLFIRKSPPQEHSISLLYEILLSGAIYWILWGIYAQGVIWYGYGGFIFLLLLIIEIIHFFQQASGNIIRYVIHISIVLWFCCSLILRMANLPSYAIFIDPVGLSYARGMIDEQGYLQQKIPTYLSILSIINRDIDTHPDTPPKIYRIGTFIKYFIHQNNRLVLDDNQLDIFMYISQDHDDQKTIARLKNAGFKYMIIDTNTASIDKTPRKTLTAKYQALMRFIQQNQQHLSILVNEPQNGILFVRIL
jgi:hypothetical protein